MTITSRAITIFLSFFMLVPGMVKFLEPFRTFYTKQILLSELPFPALSYWSGQIGEIITGLILLYLIFMSNKINYRWRDLLFFSAHLIVTSILLVSLYVHYHPAVPAEILPFESKPPYLSFLMLILIPVNIKLVQKNTNRVKSESGYKLSDKIKD